MSQNYMGILRLLYEEFGDDVIDLVRTKGADYVKEQMGMRLGAAGTHKARPADTSAESTEQPPHFAGEGPAEGDTPDIGERNAEAPDVEDADETETSRDRSRTADGVAEPPDTQMKVQVINAIAHPADVITVVSNLILMAGEVRKFEETQVTERVGIAAERDVAIANVKAQTEILQTYLDRSFDERASNFSRLFGLVDNALQTNNMQALALGLDSVVKLAASSPFKVLESVQETSAALGEPKHEWNF